MLTGLAAYLKKSQLQDQRATISQGNRQNATDRTEYLGPPPVSVHTGAHIHTLRVLIQECVF